MKKFQKALRLIGFILMIMMAAAAGGFGANIFPNYRDRYENNPIRMEAKARKDDHENEEADERN
jgi:hypothetical protein